jgi:MtN3 and saliva related transmembrane protein
MERTVQAYIHSSKNNFMPLQVETIVGVVASVLTAFSLLPQLVKLLQTNETIGLSMWTWGILFGGLASWIGYGILIEDWIIIISNSISILINSMIVVFSLMYGNPSK